MFKIPVDDYILPLDLLCIKMYVCFLYPLPKAEGYRFVHVRPSGAITK